jgi:hypothetical protein
MSAPAAARKGRAGFTPYFQLQTFSARSCSWQAAKGSHWTEEEARAAAKPGTQVRLVRVAPEGRSILDTFTA